MYCSSCGLKQPPEHRFCPSCGARLARNLAMRAPKVTQWFWTIPVTPEDPPQAALRVSCYLEEFEIESEGSSVRIPRDHVRFSVWVDDQAIAAVSIPNDEAQRLIEFLQAWVPATALDVPAEA
jgi:hypothetical protein